MRNLISIAWTSLWAAGALTLAACGGGGGGGTSVGTAALKGAVVLRDGTTSNLGGIRITDTRTGRTITTTGTGAFDFGSVPAGTITLAVTDPLAPAALRVAPLESGSGEAGDGGGSGTDDGLMHDGEVRDGQDDGDAHDVGDTDADEEGVQNEDEIECEIEVENGDISAIRFHHKDGDRRDGASVLTRAETSDDADVAGSVRMESRDGVDTLSIRAEHLTTGRSVEAFLIGPDGAEATLGTTFASDGGVAERAISSGDGALPLGATTMSDLSGFRVEVRDGNDGTVLLMGEVPQLPTGTVGGDDGDGGHDGENSLGRALIPAVVDGSGEAHVTLRADETQRFEAEVVRGVAGTVIEIWLANPANGGALEKVGEMTVGAEGVAELEMGEEGTALPFGVAHASDLAGLAVEFRATDGTVLFAGTTPALVSH